MTDLAVADIDNPLADGDLLVGTDRTKVAGELAFGLRPVDLAGGLAGLLLCIGHLPAVLAPAWTVLCTDGVSSAGLPLLPDDQPPTADVP